MKILFHFHSASHQVPPVAKLNFESLKFTNQNVSLSIADRRVIECVSVCVCVCASSVCHFFPFVRCATMLVLPLVADVRPTGGCWSCERLLGGPRLTTATHPWRSISGLIHAKMEAVTQVRWFVLIVLQVAGPVLVQLSCSQFSSFRVPFHPRHPFDEVGRRQRRAKRRENSISLTRVITRKGHVTRVQKEERYRSDTFRQDFLFSSFRRMTTNLWSFYCLASVSSVQFHSNLTQYESRIPCRVPKWKKHISNFPAGIVRSIPEYWIPWKNDFDELCKTFPTSKFNVPPLHF